MLHPPIKFLTMLPVLAAFALAPMSAISYAEETSDPPFQIERQALQFELQGSEHHLRIDNPHGDIRVRSGLLDKIEILVVKQIIGEHPVSPTLVTSIGSLKSSISVRYPKRPKPLYGRIDLVIYLPPEAHLTLSTVDSAIQVKGWQGVIEAKSRSGKITADSRNQLLLKSVSGEIVAGLFEGKRIGDSRIRTRSGSINLSVEKSTSTEVRAQTCGALESLSHSLKSIKTARCAKARAIFAAGTHTTMVQSRSGSVLINAM